MKTTAQRKKERAAERFRRQFHSKKRVMFFKALPCEVTGKVHVWRIENAHTQSDGTARRGPYESIVPLLDRVHHAFDTMGEEQFEELHGRTKQSIRDRAPYYANLWQESQE